jgi:UDP:flavonoid glycosyltransferase YjiC (YdhE family)
VLRTVSDSAALTDNLCRVGPALLKSLGVEAIVGDQMEPAAGLLARHLRLKFVSVACALPLERDERIPPPYLDWPYALDEAGLKRNRGGELISKLLLTRQRQTIRSWSRRFGLDPELRSIEDCLAPAGTVSQIVPALDFPRQTGARPIIGVGPIRGEAAFPAGAGISIIREKPFVFMSLGTLQGHRFDVFRKVARACQRLDAQLLVAHCGGLTAEQEQQLGATWVTDFVDQRDVLAQADICVTHGGQNTVLDALGAGKPLLIMPIAFDQPGIAARVEHHGLGIKMSVRRLTVSKAEKALSVLLAESSFRERAEAFSGAVAAAGGAAQAALAVERLLVQQDRPSTAKI